MSVLELEVRSLVAEIIERDAQELDSDALLVEDLGMDSMMALEILAALEKKYQIKIPEGELPKLTTLNRITELTKKYVKT